MLDWGRSRGGRLSFGHGRQVGVEPVSGGCLEEPRVLAVVDVSGHDKVLGKLHGHERFHQSVHDDERPLEAVGRRYFLTQLRCRLRQRKPTCKNTHI